MDSQNKYNEKKQEELARYRTKFAGQKIVCCATSVDKCVVDHFDFTNIKPEDINFGIHGEEYIVAKARNKHTGEIKPCFLKWVTKEATVISYKENKTPETDLYLKYAVKDFNVEQIPGYKEEFKSALISHINSGIYKNEDLKPENFKIEGRNIEFASNNRAHWFNLENIWPKKMQGKMLWPDIVDQEIMDKVRKAYEGKSFQEVATKMATGKFPEENKTNSAPSHYSNDKGYDLIDVIADYKLNFNRGNAAKYIFRAGKKDDEVKDLNKAIDYLQREIAIIQKSQE